MGSKQALFVEQETDRGPPTHVSQRIDEAHQVTQQFPPWSAQEEQALVLLYTDGTRWSSRASKGDRFGRMLGPISRDRSIHSIVEQVCYVKACMLVLLSQDSEF